MAEQEQQAVKCAIVVGIKEDGSVFLETHGSEQNLITIEGLLSYGQRYVESEWAQRKSAQAGTAEPEVEVIPPKPRKKAAPRKKKEVVVDA